MRFASALTLLAAFVVSALALTACPTPRVPKGPPPEYEDPPAPSWIDGGAVRSLEGGAPPATTLPRPDETPPQPAPS